MLTQTTNRWYHYLALAGVLAAALFLRVYNISSVGYGNLYYASTVFSMLTSPGNFFFGSFDPSGFVTVDKPPLGLWIQALSASIFGFEGWALLLPQIMAGVLACLVLYWLVRRYYGPNAGILAALILAVTPITVAADRNNTMDAQLVLVLLLSASALMLAVEKGSLKWLLGGALLIGIGFNIKMLQAFMILPAFYGLYFLAANTTWFKKIVHLAIATLVILVVSFSWALAVDAIPAEYRPYIGSSQDNSVTELITGHNGVKRLGSMASLLGLKPASGPGPQNGLASQPPSGLPPLNPDGTQPQPGNFAPPNGQRPPQGGQGRLGGQGGPMGNETGTAGILRLFNQSLVGQVSWLLPLALVMMLALSFRQKFTWPLNRGSQFALFWGLWLIPMVIFFSFAGLFHRYYLEMLAPAIATLVAAGLVSLTDDFIEQHTIGWLLPVSILGSAIFEAAVAGIRWPGWAGWAAVLTVLLGGAAGLGLIMMRVLPSTFRIGVRQIVMLGVVALLVIPVLWSTTPLHSSDVGLPYAGPELVQRQSPNQQNARLTDDAAPRRDNNNNLTNSIKLVEYLNAHYNGETFIVAGMRASDVAPVILQTGKGAMAIGGFSGSDPILTLDKFTAYIKNGQLRFVLTGNSGPNGNNKQDISQWVTNNCTPVPEADWSSGSAPSNGPGQGGQALYDCK